MSKLSKRNRRGSSQGEARPFEGMRQVNPHTAGVDIGAHAIMACVPDGDDQQIVRAFGTYPADLDALADWFIDRGIQTVAMESTGVYWIPGFETLEARGLHGCLRSAQAIKYVPGRNSDVLDCQWIQTLHSYGVLKASFRPDADLVTLRTLLRHRAQLIQHRAPHVLHRQKALLPMNIAVHGISTSIAQTILSEIGTDMSQWPDDKHFCSWLGLAPQKAISGGKSLKSRTMKTRNRAAQAFRMAAQSVRRADGALGACSRRLNGRLGPAQALVATAHNMARTVYHMRKDRVPYSDIGAAEYNKRFRERALQYLQKKAAKLGYTLSLAH